MKSFLKCENCGRLWVLRPTWRTLAVPAEEYLYVPKLPFTLRKLMKVWEHSYFRILVAVVLLYK